MPMIESYVPVVPYGASMRFNSAPARMLSTNAQSIHRTSPARDIIKPAHMCAITSCASIHGNNSRTALTLGLALLIQWLAAIAHDLIVTDSSAHMGTVT